MDNKFLRGLSFISIVVLAVAIFSFSAYAIGVSPAKKVIGFEPKLSDEYEFTIVNNEGRAFDALIHARGELAEYVSFDDRVVSLKADETSKTIKYSLKLPDDLGKPGIHDVDLVVTEFQIDSQTGGTSTVINAKQSVYSKLQITVPTPGKYAEGSLNIETANIGESVHFTIPLFNFGTDTIKHATAIIEIEKLDGSQVATFATNEISLETKQQGDLKASWTADVDPGVYYARATIAYDEKQLVLENSFEVGKLKVDITKIDIAPFSLGQIAKLDIYLKNTWNQLIQNVYGQVSVWSQTGRELSSFKTASIDLDPQASGVITSYWDTAGISAGTYDLKVELHYAGRITEEHVKATVNIDSIVTSYGGTAKVIEKSQESGSGIAGIPILTLLVIILVVVNFGWFIYFWRSRHK